MISNACTLYGHTHIHFSLFGLMLRVMYVLQDILINNSVPPALGKALSCFSGTMQQCKSQAQKEMFFFSSHFGVVKVD